MIEMKNILLPLAGKADEGRLIHQAVDMAHYLRARLTVLHVNSPKAGKLSMMMDSQPLITERAIRDRFRMLGFEEAADEIAVQVVTSAAISKEIIRAAAEADLVMVGRSRKNRLTATLVESLDRTLPDKIACPVMYVQDDDDAERWLAKGRPETAPTPVR